MKLNKEQIEELIENPNTKKIDEWAGKHDYHYEVFVSKIEDKYFQYTLEYSYNEGLISFDYNDYVEAVEVRPVEVKTIKWEEVKDNE